MVVGDMSDSTPLTRQLRVIVDVVVFASGVEDSKPVTETVDVIVEAVSMLFLNM